MIVETRNRQFGGLWLSAMLERLTEACPNARIVRESERWSRRAAARRGRCRIYGPAQLRGETLPFDPEAVDVQIAWTPIRNTATIAWVATWPKQA